MHSCWSILLILMARISLGKVAWFGARPDDIWAILYSYSQTFNWFSFSFSWQLIQPSLLGQFSLQGICTAGAKKGDEEEEVLQRERDNTLEVQASLSQYTLGLHNAHNVFRCDPITGNRNRLVGIAQARAVECFCSFQWILLKRYNRVTDSKEI